MSPAGVWRKSSILLLLRLSAAALGLVLNLLLGRLLGAEGAGAYYISLTAVMFLVTLGAMGFPTLVMKSAAHARSEGGEQVDLHVLRQTLSSAGLITSLLVVPIFILASPVSLLLYGDSGLSSTLAVMALGAIPFVLLSICAGALRGFGAAVVSFIVQFFVPTLAMCLLVAWLAPVYGVRAAAYAYPIAYTVALVLALAYLFYAAGVACAKKQTSSPGELVSLGAPFLGVDMVRVTSQWFPLMLLGIYAATEEVGVFTITLRTALVIGFLLTAVSAIVAPKFASLHLQGREAEMIDLQRSTVRQMLPVCALAVLALCWYADAVLALFGGEFVAGRYLLVLLALGQLVSALLGLNEVVLLMCGHESAVRNIHFLAMVATIPVGLVLIPLFGASGAAGTLLLNWLAVALSCTILVRRRYSHSDNRSGGFGGRGGR